MNADEIYLELKNIGCCNRCCLRFLGENTSNFEDPEESLQILLPFTFQESIKAKKVRPNPCCVCLGLLEESFLDALLSHSCWKELEEYEIDTFRVNLNTPPNMYIREKAVSLYMKQKFPEFYSVHNQSDILMHTVFKLAFKNKLSQHCGKRYDVHSGVQLWTTLHHDDNEEEIKVMLNLDPLYKQRKRGNDVYGKNAVNNALSKVDDKKFLKYVKVPPEIPSSQVKIELVQFETLPIYFAGRYCKYSRSMSQTPWHADCVVDAVESSDVDEGPITTCVQDIIYDGLRQVFGFEKEVMTFSASGREDTDVRCLGSGRPFCVKIEGVRKSFPNEYFRKLEETINQSPDVSVFDMQQADKNAIKEVKLGEEFKRKTYVALCLIRNKNYAEELVNMINIQGCESLVIQQNTPLRVAHRRNLAIREKRIFYMKATEVPGYTDIFQLIMLVQAGTYIKEFIHGDFGRTRPCVGDCIGADIDIFRLDVIDIEIDWPIHINSVPHRYMKKSGNPSSQLIIKQEPYDSSAVAMSIDRIKAEIEENDY